MKKYALCLTGVLLICQFFCVLPQGNVYGQVIEEWVAVYNGMGGGTDRPKDLALDNEGNVIVTGYSSVEVTSWDYCTVKYSPAGDSLWVNRYNGSANAADQAYHLVIDDSDNVYVTGFAGNLGNWEDYATVKYSPSGAEEWAAVYDGIGNYQDFANDIAVDTDGNVYVTGDSDNDIVTIKYNTQGDTLWLSRYSGFPTTDEEGVAVAVGDNGDVYVTGRSWWFGTEADIATIKYDADGVQQWVVLYDGEGNEYDCPTALALGPGGYVYVTGISDGSSLTRDVITIKYDSEGNELWVQRYNGPGNGIDEASAIALDSDGNVFVTGCSLGDGTSRDIVTIKYNREGYLQWIARYNGPDNLWDEAFDIDVDLYGNAYVTGFVDTYSTGDDFITIKYDPYGNEQWVANYNGAANDWDQAEAIAVDDSCNVYITGRSENIETGCDYVTIKYRQETAQFPDVSITLTPELSPIQIPASGGEFGFNIAVANHETSSITGTVWCDVLLPGGSVYGPALGPFTLSLSPGFSGDRDRTQTVPAVAPSGNYTYRAYIGEYPNQVWAEDSFQFEKLETGGGNWIGDWENTGESFEDKFTEVPASFILHPAYPNPFNPTTSIAFSLPEAADITLSIFDVHGRLVDTLVNGHRGPGRHDVTFDASGLPSGIYFYQLSTSDFQSTDKIVLMK